MLIRIAVLALDKSPFLRRLLWRWWYGRLASKFTQRSWTFMNYGYEQEAGAALLPLDPEDEPDRLCAQLYEQVVAGVGLRGREVVEVGSGRGGGASYLTRTHRPSRYTGIDYSAAAVKLCRGAHGSVAGLTFVTGDAEHLPLPDASCDVVVNVESSHCYGDVTKFFGEVARVLRPGGHFAYADFRSPADMEKVAAQLAATAGLHLTEHFDITERVLAALTSDDARKRRLIEEIVPPRLQHLFGEFAGLSGGQVFRAFGKREMVYHRFQCRKS
ncbi:MAG: class I SAM-dependent methyltransferase [Planctomycetes bacterium]|nr:class I SAM-dependent methyltransferase [Planctomycetota bacterium]